MNGALDGAVELLDRSLAYTAVALSTVRPALLGRPTPCAGWDLRTLLAHMEDALDAFTEAASGRVEIVPTVAGGTRVEALRDKACALLTAWRAAARAEQVRVGDLGLDAPVLVATAALEITLHGWDVSQATGRRTPIPDDLARGLLALAAALIDPADRTSRFGPPRPVAALAPYGERLVAWSGRTGPVRTTGPASPNRADPRTGEGVAS